MYPTTGDLGVMLGGSSVSNISFWLTKNDLWNLAVSSFRCVTDPLSQCTLLSTASSCCCRLTSSFLSESWKSSHTHTHTCAFTVCVSQPSLFVAHLCAGSRNIRDTIPKRFCCTLITRFTSLVHPQRLAIQHAGTDRLTTRSIPHPWSW